MDEGRPAHAGVGHHLPRLLHKGVAAVVEGDRVEYAGRARRVQQFATLRGRVGQRFVADHVLAARDRGHGDRMMQVVGRGDVDHVDFGIVQQRLVAAVGAGDAQLVRGSLRAVLAASGQRDHVHVAQPAQGVDMPGTDEAGTHQAGADAGTHAAGCCAAASGGAPVAAVVVMSLGTRWRCM